MGVSFPSSNLYDIISFLPTATRQLPAPSRYKKGDIFRCFIIFTHSLELLNITTSPITAPTNSVSPRTHAPKGNAEIRECYND